MKEAVKKEILYDLQQAIQILEVREEKDLLELRKLSNHAIEDVALHKDLDVISITVLLYSIYKVITNMNDQDYQNLVKNLKLAKNNLTDNKFRAYNSNIRALFKLVKTSNAHVKKHLQDVMQAARIKKGTALLHKGLSIGQAAGLMGLSNWDLQEYAGKTTTLGDHSETISATRRLQRAYKIFNIK